MSSTRVPTQENSALYELNSPHLSNIMQPVAKVRKKANIRNRYNQVPHLTRDTIWENDKKTRKLHKQESQEVSHFPAGDHKAARNRQDIKDKRET